MRQKVKNVTHESTKDELKGSEIVKNSSFVTYEEAKKIIAGVPNRPKTKEEYFKWWEDNKEYCLSVGLPPNPEEYYKIKIN